MGRRLPLHSWGWRGQIDDLARMPAILRTRAPVAADRRRSACTPSAGAWAARRRSCSSDSIRACSPERSPSTRSPTSGFATSSSRAARADPCSRRSRGSRSAGRRARNPQAFVLRSPLHWIREIADSGVPLQIWWSDADEIVVNQHTQSGRFFKELQELEPRGRLEKVTGSWGHTAKSYAQLQLPGAVAWLGPDPGRLARDRNSLARTSIARTS